MKRTNHATQLRKAGRLIYISVWDADMWNELSPPEREWWFNLAAAVEKLILTGNQPKPLRSRAKAEVNR